MKKSRLFKHSIIAIGAVFVASVIGAYAFLFREYQDVLVAEVQGASHTFEFWLDLEVFDEGDPALVLKVRKNGTAKYDSIVLAGFVSDWYESRRRLEFETLTFGATSAVILDDDKSKPLAVWDDQSGLFAPSQRGFSVEAESDWLAGALEQIGSRTGMDTCLGLLSHGAVECRYKTARAP